MSVVFLPVEDVVAAAVDKLFKPAFVYPLAGFFEVFIMDFLNNFKDFFTQFFSASFAFPEYIMYMSVPFIVGLAVKIFNKVRFGKC